MGGGARPAPTARAVAELVGPTGHPAPSRRSPRIQQALSALDRLEVRGRDSAGLHLLVTDHGLDLDVPQRGVDARRAPARSALPVGLGAQRRRGTLVRLQGGGRDRRARRQHGRLRAGDPRRRAPASRPHAADERAASVLGHTRWASVGIISSPTPTLCNSRSRETTPTSGPRSTAMSTTSPTSRRRRASHGARDHHRRQGHPHAGLAPPADEPTSTRPSAHRSRLRGSVAIAAGTAATPTASCSRCAAVVRRSTSAGRGRLHRRQRALRPGRGDLALPAARRRDAGQPENPTASRGPDRRRSTASQGGSSVGIVRQAYDGTRSRSPRTTSPRRRSPPATSTEATTPLPPEGDHRGAAVVPQDPAGQARRARGGAAGHARRRDVLRRRRRAAARRQHPPGARDRAGHRRRGRPEPGGAAASCIADVDIGVEALPATELSGFALRSDMCDTLVVAISQSGTTTDTNRTVDLVRAAAPPWWPS